MRTPRSTRVGKALRFFCVWGGLLKHQHHDSGASWVISQGSDQTHTNTSLDREPAPSDLHPLAGTGVCGFQPRERPSQVSLQDLPWCLCWDRLRLPPMAWTWSQGVPAPHEHALCVCKMGQSSPDDGGWTGMFSPLDKSRLSQVSSGALGETN